MKSFKVIVAVPCVVLAGCLAGYFITNHRTMPEPPAWMINQGVSGSGLPYRDWTVRGLGGRYGYVFSGHFFTTRGQITSFGFRRTVYLGPLSFDITPATGVVVVAAAALGAAAMLLLFLKRKSVSHGDAIKLKEKENFTVSLKFARLDLPDGQSNHRERDW